MERARRLRDIIAVKNKQKKIIIEKEKKALTAILFGEMLFYKLNEHRAVNLWREKKEDELPKAINLSFFCFCFLVHTPNDIFCF